MTIAVRSILILLAAFLLTGCTTVRAVKNTKNIDAKYTSQDGAKIRLKYDKAPSAAQKVEPSTRLRQATAGHARLRPSATARRASKSKSKR